MSTRYGATRAEWDAFAKLNLPDVLPWVADASVPLHPGCSWGAYRPKTPSQIIDNARGYGIAGFLDWTKRRTTSIEDWAMDDRHGICLVGRRIKCFDIDIKDIPFALEVEATIREHLGIDGFSMPLRDREGTGSRHLFFRIAEGTSLMKQRVRVGLNAMVEFLGDRQHFVVAGRHEDGHYYRWPEGIPSSLEEIPEFTIEQIADVYNMLRHRYQSNSPDWRSTHAEIPRTPGVNYYKDDPVVQYLIENDLVIGYSNHNGVYVKCPWGHKHSTELKDDDAEYFPAGANGRAQHGFSCFHGHSVGPPLPFGDPTVVEFLEVIGYRSKEIDAEFNVTPAAPAASVRPKFTYKGRSAVIENTISNVTSMLRWSEGGGYHLRYDRFKDTLIYRLDGQDKWHALDDDTYTAIRIAFSAKGMESPSHETVMRAVSFVAREQAVDTAQEWLNAQHWDGVERIPGFHVRVLGMEDNEYHQALVNYMWTALAGRVLDPGCKADMVPIFTGAQGLRKSSFVEALAPTMDEFAAVTLAERDENLSRQLRGKLVVEWDELRGLNSRDNDSLKGWVTRRKDDWIPKFKEFGTSLARRFLLIGTTNWKRYLNDPTGLRRWLPGVVTQPIDVDYVIANRKQLWAEARVMWQAEFDRTRTTGVLWKDAELLAVTAQQQASIRDPWVDAVAAWYEVCENIGPWTSLQILNQACNLPASQVNVGTQERLRRVMAFMGWEEETSGHWSPPLA